MNLSKLESKPKNDFKIFFPGGTNDVVTDT